MKRKRILALLCAAALCCMSFSAVVPTAMAEEISAEEQAAREAEAARKAAEEEAARRAAEEEAARKAAEEEAARRAAEEEAARRAAEEEAARKAAEEEAARKAAEEEAARKAAEEEAARKAAEEEAARKAAEEEAARKAAEEEAARKAAEEEAARKAAEEEAARKAAEEEAAKKAAEEEAAKKAAEEEAAKKAAEEEAAKKAAEEEAAQKAADEEAAAQKAADEEAARKAAEEEAAQKAADEEAARKAAEEEAARKAAEEEAARKAAEEAAAAATPEPTPEVTPEPVVVEEPTPEPTPLPVALSGLSASTGETTPGAIVHFTYHAENADTVIWSAKRSDGLSGGAGSAFDGAFDWQPAHSGVYTITLNATGGAQTLSESVRVVVRDGRLKVKANGDTDYAVAGHPEMIFNLSVSGGVEPYAVSVVVDWKGHKLYESSTFTPQVIVNARDYGENILTLEVTDAVGATAKTTAMILSANDKTNEGLPLPALKGDMTFAEKLVAVAKSQLGYHEMVENFGYKEDGTVTGWSFYGKWYGMPYEEWCAMFVCYCLDMSGVGKGMMAGVANCNRWKNGLGKRYIDDEDDYIPAAGDLIFFHHDRVSDDPNFPNHIGIVTDYDPETDTVYTVEGNSGMMVRTHQYNRLDGVIVGYASMARVMCRHDEVYRQNLKDALHEDLTEVKGNSVQAAKNRAKRVKKAA